MKSTLSFFPWRGGGGENPSYIIMIGILKLALDLLTIKFLF